MLFAWALHAPMVRRSVLRSKMVNSTSGQHTLRNLPRFSTTERFAPPTLLCRVRLDNNFKFGKNEDALQGGHMPTCLSSALLRAQILLSPNPRRCFAEGIRAWVDAGEDTIGANAVFEELETELFELGTPPDEEQPDK
jgi:hypothetical protein